MLYALVNNDYQLHALRRHGIEALGGPDGVALILVPHALSLPLDARDFHSVHRFDTPLGRSRMPFTLWRYGGLARDVARSLAPRPTDTLLFFTETEWLNQIVVQHFHRGGARVVMLEDGGFATYIPMAVRESEPLSLRERCVQAAYRLLPALRRSRLFKVNGQAFPRLPDDSIDAIGLYQDVGLQRQVDVCRVLKPSRKICELRQGSVIFLNERMYDHYQDAEHYLAGLRRLMAPLVQGFEKVYFKYHPREPDEWKHRIGTLLAGEFPSIELIDRAGTVENMILDYRPEVLASYFSAGLLSIEYQGIEPLYLYHLLDDLKDQPVFMIATRILGSWGYRFVRSGDEIKTGYRSGITSDHPGTCTPLRQFLQSSEPATLAASHSSSY
ncbi:MAG: hypothetical protein JO218_18425 [Burkholderiales bacterium]|nr:hypothetical protein [Burkholderiales bacterium]